MITIPETIAHEYKEQRRIITTASSLILKAQAEQRARQLLEKYRKLTGMNINDHGRKMA